MLNSELAALKWIALVSTAHSKCSIAVREHLGDYQLMCHAPIALAAAFVPDTEGVQVSTGTRVLVGIHRDVFQREFTFCLAPKTTVFHNLLRALALDS